MTRQSLAVAFKERAGQAGQFVSSRPDWFLERFAKMPTTNFLFLLVAYLAVRTCEHYVRTPNWVPSVEWLGFIIGLTGGAITQWVRKRTSDHEYQRILHGQSVPRPDKEPDK